jgi:peptidoglycan/xylan/chitin deacetylase (PgdA/CDA1 family)
MPLRIFLALLLLGVSKEPIPDAFVPPPILMFHRVDVDRPVDPVGLALTITPAQLRGELAYLQERHVRGISLAQLAERLERGQPLDHVVALTFDDGYADQYRYALPLLQRFGDTATFFIVTGDVGDGRHLSWTDLQRMQQAHMDVGAHGVQHFDLSTMTPAEQAAQIDGSIASLRAHLHDRVLSYAYPSGRLNRTTLELESAAGIVLAVTTDPRFVLPPQSRLELTRLRVPRGWGIPAFAQALRSARAGAGIVVW